MATVAAAGVVFLAVAVSSAGAAAGEAGAGEVETDGATDELAAAAEPVVQAEIAAEAADSPESLIDVTL